MSWSRDEIGEYHDGHGNIIFRDVDGWQYMLERDFGPKGPFKTLQAAKAAVAAASEGTLGPRGQKDAS